MRFPLVKTGVITGSEPHVVHFREGFKVAASAWDGNVLGHYTLSHLFATKAEAERMVVRVSKAFSIDPALWECDSVWCDSAEFEDMADRKAWRERPRQRAEKV